MSYLCTKHLKDFSSYLKYQPKSSRCLTCSVSSLTSLISYLILLRYFSAPNQNLCFLSTNLGKDRNKNKSQKNIHVWAASFSFTYLNSHFMSFIFLKWIGLANYVPRIWLYVSMSAILLVVVSRNGIAWDSGSQVRMPMRIICGIFQFCWIWISQIELGNLHFDKFSMFDFVQVILRQPA